jgi:deoxyribonuclease IV
VILGAHVRRDREATSGLVRACRERGADCAQVFLSNPRGWAPPSISDEDASALRDALAEAGLGPLVAHAPYLVNVAAPDPAFLAKSRELAAATVRAADRTGVSAVVLHAGSGGAADPDAARSLAAATLRAAGREASRTRVVVELMAGGRGAVASTIEEATRLLEETGDDRIGLCLDTAHLFATGYDLADPDGVGALVEELHRHGVIDRLALVHANDAEFPLGSHRDRHRDIGEGYIGEGFRNLVSTAELGTLPWILETPGDAARQRADIERLRQWANGPAGSGGRGRPA